MKRNKNNMKNNWLITIFILLSLSASAQRGKHGNLTVNTANRVLNEYTQLTFNANAGNTSILVASNNLNINGRFSGPLEAGDLVMIIQIQGVSLNAFPAFDPNQSMPFDETWGAVLNYNNCGNYEFAEVHSLNGATQINLVCGLKNTYTAAGKVQVIRVPRYNNLGVSNSASINCDPWNGQTGGIVAIETLGNLTILSGGSIHANGRGFRGGQALLNTPNTGGMQYGHNNANEGAEKGEGVFGYKTEYNALGGGMYCKGAAGNAGGGGNMHNAGGGGGGNGGNISAYTGFGNPDNSGPNWATAWNLESSGFATHTSSGGGRGGYTFASANLNALSVGPGDVSWGGDARREQGGRGGRPLDYSTGKIFIGGGGGAGHQNDDYAGDGGNGGGIVYLLSYGNISGGGTISSNGQPGFNAVGSTPPVFSSTVTGTDGAGGGGAGGAVLIHCQGSLSGVSIYANGGDGGDQNIQKGSFATNNESEGPGGGGGGGYIAISTGTPFRQAIGGACGTTNSSGLTEFNPNGATAGGAGINNAVITPTLLSVNSPINACTGDNVSITAGLGGNIPSGTQIVWWNTQVAGTPVHTGPTITIPNIQTSQTVWVGFCPGWYRIPVVINVSGPVCTASADTTICLGNTIQLNASGGLTYTWSPASTLNNPNISNPVASPSTTTTYYVTAYDGICSDIDSVSVTVSQVNASAANDTTICAGESVQLWASGGIVYNWSSGSTLSNAAISNPIASPLVNTTYTVTVSNALNCQDTESVTVTVNPLPVISLGNDTTLCSGDVLTLDAGSGFSSYFWNPSGSTQTLQVSTSGIYSVTVTDNNQCSGSDNISVSVLPNADATIIEILPVCSNANQIQMNAAEQGGIWSGIGISSTGLFQPSIAGAGIHTIIYTISGICGDSDTVTVTVFAAPQINLGPDTSLCSGDVLTLDAGAGFSSYFWAPAGNTQTLQVSTSGTYSVTVTDNNQCSGSDNISVSVLPNADATITDVLPLCSNAAQITLTSVQSGGVWSGTGISNPAGGIFNPSTAGAGDHIITYTIVGSCGDSDSTIITVLEIPSGLVSATNESCSGANDGSISLSVSGGLPDYMLQWSNGSTTLQIIQLEPGIYTVQITDANGCAVTTSGTVIASSEACFTNHVFVPNIFSPDGNGHNDALFVRGSGIEYMEFVIFNRWGQKIFETTNQSQGWDGTFKGQNVEAGVYSYFLNVTFEDNTKGKYSGSITVVY